MAKKSSTWTMTIFEEEDDVIKVKLKGPSRKVNDLMVLETLLRGLRAWDTDVDFKEGKMPKEITKTWIMPLTKIKAKLNPIRGKKIKANDDEVKDFEHAIALYRDFNGVEPSEIVMTPVWMPDATSPLLHWEKANALSWATPPAKRTKTENWTHTFTTSERTTMEKSQKKDLGFMSRSLLRATNPSS